jgi:serine/alanine adding enzyme
MRVVQHLDEHVWRRFVDEHPRGNIFHTPEMFHVFAQADDHQPHIWAVLSNDSRVLALLTPVYVTLINGLLHRLTTRSLVYGGALFLEGREGEQALRLLLKAYTRMGAGHALFSELRNLDESGGMRPLFEGCGYTYENHLNYLINLNRPTEEIMGGIGARTRKQIRKGLRDRHIEIAELADRAELDLWYAVLQQTYQRARVPLADRSLFAAAFDTLRPLGMARFLAARIEGVIVACSLELCYKRTIYGWYGGSDRAYSKYLPNELLTWHILEWGATNCYQVYDFGGAGKQSEAYGVRAFKAKFGGSLVSFGRYTYAHSPRLLRLSRMAYQLYRNIL